MEQQKNKTWFWILIAVILTAIIVGGGVYYFENKRATEAKNDLNNQITNLQSQIDTLKSSTATSNSSTSTNPTTSNPNTSATTADETANWQTYTNSKYGWSIKYPSSITVKDNGAQGTSLKIVDQVVFNEGSDTAMTVTNYDYNVSDSQFKTPFVGTIVPAHYDTKISEDLTKVNSMPAIELVAAGPKDTRIKNYYLRDSNNNLVSIGISNNYIDNTKVEKILNTFSFVN